MFRMCTAVAMLAWLAVGAGDLAARPALTGTGGGPETTITAPHTAATGQTIPPGAVGAPNVDPSERTARQRDLDRVLNGICEGC